MDHNKQKFPQLLATTWKSEKENLNIASNKKKEFCIQSEKVSQKKKIFVSHINNLQKSTIFIFVVYLT